MPEQMPARIVDVSEVQLRIAMVKAAVWLTFTVCGAGLAYVGVTWEQTDRSTLVNLFAIAAIPGLLIVLLPIQRIVRSRFNGVFFVVWSLVQIALIGAIVATDGGASS